MSAGMAKEVSRTLRQGFRASLAWRVRLSRQYVSPSGHGVATLPCVGAGTAIVRGTQANELALLQTECWPSPQYRWPLRCLAYHRKRHNKRQCLSGAPSCLACTASCSASSGPRMPAIRSGCPHSNRSRGLTRLHNADDCCANACAKIFSGMYDQEKCTVSEKSRGE